MTDWQSVIDADFAVPADRALPGLIDELVAALRSPDPVLRDDHALTVLAQWIPQLDEAARADLGSRLAAMLTEPEIQTRTFAALGLAVVVRNDSFREEWLKAFESWFVNEQDLRGHDAELGWLHAVAHGADALRVLAQRPEVSVPALLDTATVRMLTPTEYVWRDQEDDRLAHAIAAALTREDLTEADSVGWLDAIETEFAAGEHGPVPPFASNTIRTLRMVYLLADRGVRRSWGQDAVAVTHAAAVKARLAEVLAIVSPMAG